MLHRCCAALLLIASRGAFAGQDAPKPAPAPAPLVSEERSPEWLIAIERLRSLPRPGDLQNAGVFANIANVIETTPEQKTAIVAAMKL